MEYNAYVRIVSLVLEAKGTNLKINPSTWQKKPKVSSTLQSTLDKQKDALAHLKQQRAIKRAQVKENQNLSVTVNGLSSI